jgi:hypothetical protein
MNRYISNCSHLINWKIIIDSLEKTSSGEVYDDNLFNSIFYKEDLLKNSNEYHNKTTLSIWKDAGYNLKSIDFRLYRPKTHYDSSVNDILSNFLGGRFHKSNISKLFPGTTVGMHEDSTPISSLGNIYKRFVIFISPPTTGHVFTLGNQCFHNVDLGSIYEWENLNLLHSASNMSFDPYYLFHIECIFP